MNNSLVALQQAIAKIDNSIDVLRHDLSATEGWLFVLSAGTFVAFVLTIWLLARRSSLLAERIAKLEARIDKQ